MTSSLICDILQVSTIRYPSEWVMHWIYLSPHLDDVALSCGGLLWEQAHAGERVSVWTICAGDPPEGQFSPYAQSLHQRWETGPQAVAQRREEDLTSCTIMGASYHHFPIPDCIYRTDVSGTHLYPSDEAILGEIHSTERDLVAFLGDTLARELPQDGLIVSPMALGGHVDHRLTRAAAERVGCPLWFYADYPYVLKDSTWLESPGIGSGQPHLFTISQAGLEAWVSAVGAHRSQISTFWPDLDSMQAAIQTYSLSTSGVILWKSTELRD
jgi:LmbE family N-acetylglucosaminyl deacetylase